MTGPTGRDPGSLLKGFQKNFWKGAPENILELLGTCSRVLHIQSDIGPNRVSSLCRKGGGYEITETFKRVGFVIL